MVTNKPQYGSSVMSVAISNYSKPQVAVHSALPRINFYVCLAEWLMSQFLTLHLYRGRGFNSRLCKTYFSRRFAARDVTLNLIGSVLCLWLWDITPANQIQTFCPDLEAPSHHSGNLLHLHSFIHSMLHVVLLPSIKFGQHFLILL